MSHESMRVTFSPDVAAKLAPTGEPFRSPGETPGQRVVREVAREYDRRAAEVFGALLAWRDELQARTNTAPEDMVFLVPEQILPPGLDGVDGTRVIYQPGIERPMVAVAVPRIPG